MDDDHKNTQVLASERTDFAEDRTVLATERTFTSWIRTALTCVGVALGFRALLSHFEPAWLPKSVASVFIITAIALIGFAYRRTNRVFDRLGSHNVPAFSQAWIRSMAAVLVAAFLGLGVVLWMLD